MTKYFEVKNNNGYVQIDDTFTNMELKRKLLVSNSPLLKTHTISHKNEDGVTIKNWTEDIWDGSEWQGIVKSYNIHSGNSLWYAFALQDNERFFAIYSPSGSGVPCDYPFEKKMYQPDKSVKNVFPFTLLEDDPSKTYIYTFGPSSGISTRANYGLEVYNSAGRLLYTSAKKDFLKVKAFGTKTGNVGYTNRKIAIALLGYQRYGGHSDGNDVRIRYYRYKNGMITLEYKIVSDRTGAYRTFVDGDLSYMLIDVTDL